MLLDQEKSGLQIARSSFISSGLCLYYPCEEKKIIQSHVAQCNHDILQDHSFQQSNKHCPS